LAVKTFLNNPKPLQQVSQWHYIRSILISQTKNTFFNLVTVDGVISMAG